MYLKPLSSKNRWAVQVDREDDKFRGTVEKHEFRDEKGRTRVFWIGRATGGGWKVSTVGKFKTQRQAAEAVLKASGIPYGDRRMKWKVNPDGPPCEA